MYKHGVTAEFVESISTLPEKGETTVVYIGTAPVNLIRGWKEKGLVNRPVELSEGNYQKVIGYSPDWKKFTISEAIALHFRNEIAGIGPIVAINVLDPDIHKKEASTTTALTFVNDYARFESDTIILDTLVLADKVEGTDFEVSYDLETSSVIVHALTEIETNVNATYDEVDPLAVTADDIIGTVTQNGERKGLDAVSMVYQNLNKITNIIAAPGFSHNPTVYKKMLQVSQKINGHWYAYVVADLPLAGNDTKEKAIAWKKANNYTSENSVPCWPQWKTTDGTIYHLSTMTAWEMMLVDASNQNIPMESPSNKAIPSGTQYFGESSKNSGYDQQEANELNASGIMTAIFWGGENVLWGDHTGAYEYGKLKDNRSIFINSIRMMMYVANSFQKDHAVEIDRPMTVQMSNTIRIAEQEKADALASMGALIGSPVVVFEATDNLQGDLVEGNFTWRTKLTPTPPFKSGTLKVAYTDEGFTTYFSEGGEE